MQPNLHPYNDGLPIHPFAKPGAKIDASNVDQAQDVLVPMLYTMIKNGWVEIKVTETTPVPHHPKYLEATVKNVKGSIQFDSDGVNPVGYVSGRPFPYDPDPDDAEGGLKMLWNYRYFMIEGDAQYIHQSWRYKNMRSSKIERELKTEVHLRRLMHRVALEPLPNVADNPSQINNAFYLRVFEPFDVRNTQLLIQIYEDDNRRAMLSVAQQELRKLSTE